MRPLGRDPLKSWDPWVMTPLQLYWLEGVFCRDSSGAHSSACGPQESWDSGRQGPTYCQPACIGLAERMALAPLFPPWPCSIYWYLLVCIKKLLACLVHHKTWLCLLGFFKKLGIKKLELLMTQKWVNSLIMFLKLKNGFFFFKEKMWAILYREWKPNKRNSIK